MRSRSIHKKTNPSVRVRKVNSLLLEKISAFLVSHEIPGLHGLVTVLDVDTSPDLRQAKVWISCVGQDEAEALRLLRGQVYKIQGALYQGATMRIMPKIFFLYSDASRYAERIARVLDDLHNDQHGQAN
ncbi:MAG: ribosome-binding factor A [Candidatus Doudnabacteria bacterium]|nr:ribosome-binding factor A [Candidatus Doudnabacteria bacterium]